MVSFPEYFAKVLDAYGIDTVFGIVGIPIVELADATIASGKTRFIPFRNEQAASYAASAYGYLTGKPGVLLVVGGPGVVHSLAGIYNSMSNKWPLLVIAGSSEDEYKGGFQELDQVSFLKPHVKFTAKLTHKNIESVFYNAMRHSVLGTPGVSYIDIPGNLITEEDCIEERISGKIIISPVRYSPDPLVVSEVARLIANNEHKEILVVIGKGAVNCANEIRRFVDQFQLPFLPTPMAKGVVPDSHPLNVSSARSLALRKADVVLLLGARLNWILHFGEPPKWKDTVKFVQFDYTPEELGHNNVAGLNYSLCGDIGLSLEELGSKLHAFKYRGLDNAIREKIGTNELKLRGKERETGTALLHYNQVYALMRQYITDDETILVTEGANTMDVARISFPTDYPKRKLDAGTNATMGIGLGYALAAKASDTTKTVICIQGDSAFGFSAMELETAVRCSLPLVVVVMNNSGIYHGTVDQSGEKLPSTALSFECRYDLVAKGLGCNGFLARNLHQVEATFKEALRLSHLGETSLINVIIAPGKQGKLSFGWQNKSKM